MSRRDARWTVERLWQAPPRSWLFVPAPRAAEYLPKAIASGADAVIVDLEDATAPGEKNRARQAVAALDLGGYERPVLVRVNAAPRRQTAA
ncbi:MAG: aldolase/citrate lyase family protein, partial [Candidatus Limnocylindria bacterium]